MIDVQKIWLTPTEVWIQTADGRQACEHFADYKGLRDATPQERENYTLSPFVFIGNIWTKIFAMKGSLKELEKRK